MKLHWGHGVVIVMITFMLFILSLVYQTFQTNTDLYAANYYEQEINYQDRIDGLQNAAFLKDSIKISIQSKKVHIQYPTSLNLKTFVGEVLFFKPDDAKLDRKFIMKAQNQVQTIPLDKLSTGVYTVSWSWSQNKKPYFIEKSFKIPS